MPGKKKSQCKLIHRLTAPAIVVLLLLTLLCPVQVSAAAGTDTSEGSVISWKDYNGKHIGWFLLGAVVEE